MLAEYGTFKMANNIAFNKLNTPDWGMIVGGTIISAIGMLIGFLVNRVGNVVTGKMSKLDSEQKNVIHMMPCYQTGYYNRICQFKKVWNMVYLTGKRETIKPGSKKAGDIT